MTDHAKTIAAIRQRVSDHERMNEMERRAAPLFWLVFIAVAAFVLWQVHDQHDREIEHDVMAQIIAECASGRPVVFDEQVMTCRIVPVMGIVEGER